MAEVPVVALGEWNKEFKEVNLWGEWIMMLGCRGFKG